MKFFSNVFISLMTVGVSSGFQLAHSASDIVLISCEGEANYFSPNSGELLASPRETWLFKIDLDQQVIQPIDGPFGNASIPIIGDVASSYYGSLPMNGSARFGRKLESVEIEINRYSGQAIFHMTIENERSGLMLFFSESGCQMAKPRF